MLKIIYFVSLFAFTLAYNLQTIALAEWEAYKMEYGKTYFSISENCARMTAFLEAKNIIAEHNEKFFSGKVSYKLGISELSDWLPEEFKKNKLDQKVFSGSMAKGNQFVTPELEAKLPSSMDWRDLGAVTPVKFQGKCGSCWTFSVTGALERQHFRKNGKLISLSEQQLVDCMFESKGCNGGNTADAFEYIRANGGIDTEDSYPYLAKDGQKCRFNSSSVGATDLGHVELPKYQETDLLKAIATIGPISVNIYSDPSTFVYYKEGVYDDAACFEAVDHAVLAVGYGTSDEGLDYWIIKNSWGATWGERGYMRLIRGKNMCCISCLPLYPLV